MAEGEGVVEEGPKDTVLDELLKSVPNDFTSDGDAILQTVAMPLKDLPEVYKITKESADNKDVAGFYDDVENLKRMVCLLYTSPSPRDRQKSRMPSSA